MQKINKEYFRQLLLKEKKKILDTLGKMKSVTEVGLMDKYYNELSMYDNHPADIGTEVFMIEQDMGLVNKLNYTLREIETSLDMIDLGNYGKCIDCGKEIDIERLKLIPYLKYCINCTSKNNLIGNKNMKIRLTEYNMDFTDSTSEMDLKGFKREDDLQEIVKFNRVDKDPSYNTGDLLGIFDEGDSDKVEEIDNISNNYYKDTLK